MFTPSIVPSKSRKNKSSQSLCMNSSKKIMLNKSRFRDSWRLISWKRIWSKDWTILKGRGKKTCQRGPKNTIIFHSEGPILSNSSGRNWKRSRDMSFYSTSIAMSTRKLCKQALISVLHDRLWAHWLINWVPQWQSATQVFLMILAFHLVMLQEEKLRCSIVSRRILPKHQGPKKRWQ